MLICWGVKRVHEDVGVLIKAVTFTVQRGGNSIRCHECPRSETSAVLRPVVMPGVEELRLRDESGHCRVLCCRKARAGIFAVGAFHKKTPETPLSEIELARLAGASRPRVTSILNGNLDGVSTDLLLRILAALGVRVRLRFHRAA